MTQSTPVPSQGERGSDVAKLIERLERATGPDRELDFWCWWYGASTESKKANPQQPPEDYARENIKHNGSPRYTESIDAALTLVPEGWGWQIGGPEWSNGKRNLYFAYVRQYREPNDPRRDAEGDCRHRVPAIALTLAALKARQATGG